ncbi:MAG: DUF4091 domain-containing protein [Clostridia bacterium]|nr:DUF4091 domain-containing protein [Clostridia bacterium]
MKKYLALILILLSVFAILVACTTAGSGGETTAEHTTAAADPVTDPATDADTEAGSTDPTEVTTGGNPDSIVNPDTTAAETETAAPDPDGVRLDHERILKQISGESGVTVSREEVEGEGYVLKITSTGASNDPQVCFNYNNYRKVVKEEKIMAQDYQYIIFRVKTENCSSAKFELFYCAGSVTGVSGDCVIQAAFNNATDDWQYIVFKMTTANSWEGQLHSFRFDYQLSTAAEGETMYISSIWFAKDIEEMRAITQKGMQDPFEIETDPEVEQKVEELLATPDSATQPDNTKQNAAKEDENLDLWFNHAYINNPAEDITSTGWNTYLLRLAKNESEGTHMFLASKNGHSGLKVSVTNFKNADGAELKTELMYGYYFDDVDGQTLVDPIPWVKEGQTFDLEAGRSYMYIIKATSYMDSPAGEYTATVTVTDASGNEIKKATVKAYVWNFVLPEETSCKTQMDLSWWNIYTAHECWAGDDSLLYKNYYDLMLANRICAYTLPYSEKGYFTDERIVEYLDNPRVVAFNPLGWAVRDNIEGNVQAAYEFLSQKQEWLDKSYFYLVDEPLTLEHLDLVNEYGEMLKQYFPGYKMMAPEHVNYVWDTESKVDNFSYVKDTVNVWCFKPYFFTTFEEHNYDKSLTYWMTPKLEANLGTFAERMYAEQAEGDELWWYVTRRPESPEITLLMETEAVRHRILFWQQKLYNVDSFLYYLVNDWYEVGENNGLNKKYERQAGADGYDCYGNGVLLYCGQDFDVYGAVESIRMETVRDGIEDFEYLTMITELYGKDVTDAIIHRLTTSLSHYNTDTDNFTDLRIALGNIIEATLAEQGK